MDNNWYYDWLRSLGITPEQRPNDLASGPLGYNLRDSVLMNQAMQQAQSPAPALASPEQEYTDPYAGAVLEQEIKNAQQPRNRRMRQSYSRGNPGMLDADQMASRKAHKEAVARAEAIKGTAAIAEKAQRFNEAYAENSKPDSPYQRVRNQSYSRGGAPQGPRAVDDKGFPSLDNFGDATNEQIAAAPQMRAQGGNGGPINAGVGQTPKKPPVAANPKNDGTMPLVGTGEYGGGNAPDAWKQGVFYKQDQAQRARNLRAAVKPRLQAPHGARNVRQGINAPDLPEQVVQPRQQAQGATVNGKNYDYMRDRQGNYYLPAAAQADVAAERRSYRKNKNLRSGAGTY